MIFEMSTPQKNPDIRFNYYDYTLMPEDKRCELIDGDFYMTPSPTTTHQMILHRIESLLTEFVDKHRLGTVLFAPLDVIFSNEDVVQPDILFISNERREIIKAENIHGAPDLVVEILSPSTAQRDLVIKKKLYSRFAVREYWIVDPSQKTIEVLTWSEKGLQRDQVYSAQDALRSPLLKDFSLKVGELFPSFK